MIRINAGFSKKIPGEQPYSSDGLHLNVEVELPDQILQDPLKFSQAVRKLFVQARQEVQHQVAGGDPRGLDGAVSPEIQSDNHAPNGNGAHGNGAHGNGGGNLAGNGNGQHAGNNQNGQNGQNRQGPQASPRQVSFLISLAKRQHNLSPRELATRAGVERLTDLSKNEASNLIEELRGPQGVGR